MDVFLDKQQIMKHKIIGQAFKTYWIVEYNNELYIIDQHAAHEKVLYEEWLKSIQTLEIPSQMLLEPLVYDLSDSEFDVFETFKDEIVQLGFDVEAFGGTTIIVKSVPYLLNMPLNDIDFIHFFDQLVSGEASIKREEQYLHKIASIACKAAIKGNNKLTEIEYHGLISRLLTLDDPYHCPHGRPTMIRMSKYELEKKFRRIV
jgi:DNA mismatch repair protein MutL